MILIHTIMSCLEGSSRHQHVQPEHVSNQRPEPKRRRFHPLRGLRRIFKRKPPSPEPNEVKSCDDAIEPSLNTSRCRSSSQLIDEPFTSNRSLHSNLLSVSHDSVFNTDAHSGQFDSVSTISVPRLVLQPANIQIKAELFEAVRRRKKTQNDDDSDVDEEDLGLPRSPSMHSPTIAHGNDLLSSKELINKSSQSTCSDGSLLSMGSSEMDEDSFGLHNSRHSLKLPLPEKRTSQTYPDSSDGDSSTSVPLSHSAAKHRMAIRPKRKSGNPRSKKSLSLTSALPATPEVNEEHSGLSISPETNKPLQTAADSTTDGTTTTTTNTSTTTITTITVTSTNTAATTITTTTSADLVTDTCPISNAGDGATTAGSCDLDTSVDEISVENVPRREEGFFHRLLSRRSTKKKAATTKCSSAEDVDVDTFLFDETMGPKPRQREEPPPAGRMQLSYPPDLPPDTQPPHPRDTTTVAENIFGSADTFVPIKRSFSIGQQMVGGGDDDLTSCSGGGESSSVQKSSSSDSVSSTALDDSIASVVVEPAAVLPGDERRRSYSSSDSDHLVNGGGEGGEGVVNEYQHQHHHHQNYHQRPVPAPRPSKLFNGGGGPTDVVIRRKKRDDLQQPELFKVFARRSLKLGKDGEPELLLSIGVDVENDDGDGDDEDDYGDKEDNDEEARTVENGRVTAEASDDQKPHHRESDVVDVNENRTAAVVEVVSQFKGIQQRREEWEKLLQRN